MSEKHGISIASWSIVLQGLQWGLFLLASFQNSRILWGKGCLQEHAKLNCSRCPNGNAWLLAVMPSPYVPNIYFLQLPSTHALPAHKICFLSFKRIRTLCVPTRFNLVLKCGGWVWGYQQQSQVQSNIEVHFHIKLLVPSTFCDVLVQEIQQLVFQKIGQLLWSCLHVSVVGKVNVSMEKCRHSIWETHAEISVCITKSWRDFASASLLLKKKAWFVTVSEAVAHFKKVRCVNWNIVSEIFFPYLWGSQL